MPVSTSYLLINADLGAEDDLIRTLKEVPNVVEVHMVYGVYDIIAKVQAGDMETVKATITSKIRKLEKVRSTLTMIVVNPGS